jgi:hypothetical protein
MRKPAKIIMHPGAPPPADEAPDGLQLQIGSRLCQFSPDEHVHPSLAPPIRARPRRRPAAVVPIDAPAVRNNRATRVDSACLVAAQERSMESAPDAQRPGAKETHLMNRFAVNVRGAARKLTTEERAAHDEIVFATEPEFAQAAVSWPQARLTAVWNALPEVPPVTRFSDRRTAVSRIWKKLHTLPEPAATAPPPAPRAGKTAQLLALLRRPQGATLAELRELTGWQAHSLRGFLSGVVRRKLGLPLDRVARGEQYAYRIAD